MSEHISQKGTMAKDTIFYMIAKAIEGVIGVLTISLMSYIYLPNLMATYSTAYIAVTTMAMFGIQWLVQSVLRYVNKYTIENKLENFYSTVFIAWLKVMMIAIFLGFGMVFLLNISKSISSVSNFLKDYSLLLLILGTLLFVVYSTAQVVIALLASVRKVRVNLVLSIVSVTGKMLLIWILNRKLSVRVEWVFLSYIIMDLITVLVGLHSLKIYSYIKLSKNSPEIISELKAYGMPLMGNLLTTQVLNKSDIYIITFILGSASAGIYQTNYSIVASAFTLISYAIMRGSYPTILKTWSQGQEELSQKLISDALRFFLLVSIPAVVGITVLSDFIATVLFAPEYFEGHRIMGFVALGMMFLGITEYCIKPWELNSLTRSIFYRSLIGGAVNVLINIVFIRIFGYEVAGISTFIGFFVYFILAKFGTRKLMNFTLMLKVYFNIVFSALIMGIILIVVKNFVKINVLNLGCMVILGILIYTAVLYLTGEIKNELKDIFRKILR